MMQDVDPGRAERAARRRLDSFRGLSPEEVIGRVRGEEAEGSVAGGALRHANSRHRWARSRWVGTAAAVALLGLASLLVLLLPPGGESRVVSAEEVIERAHLTMASPHDVGIVSLVVTQRWTNYFLGEERRGVPASEGHVRLWYQAPDRQRVEVDYLERRPDGRVRTEGSGLSIWDGAEYWQHDLFEGTAFVRTQTLDTDAYHQLGGGHMMLGGFGEDGASLLAQPPACRTARLIGEAEVIGRATDVVELGPQRCGFTFPGSDGRSVVWIDQETGVSLRTERYAATGVLASIREVTGIDINGEIEPARFRFSPPPDVEVSDRRDQLSVELRPTEEPEPITLEEAREEATFEVRAPQYVPVGFALEAVQHRWGGGELARELRSHADNVTMRYGDGEGGWLVITQGFGGMLTGMASVAPEDATQGRVEVSGAEAYWVDGSPITYWEPGTMLTLSVPLGRMGAGRSTEPDGSRVTGSPLSVTLASNVLTLEELVEVAESLE